MTDETLDASLPPEIPPADPNTDDFEYTLSFPIILHRLGVSLAVTTYQAGSLCLLTSDGEDIRVATRNFRKVMGCYVHPRGLLVATQTQVIAFSTAPQLIPRYFPKENFDQLYIPQLAYYTGDITAHDIALVSGTPMVVSSTFNCLVAMHPEYSFYPMWKPHFITSLTAEDRCHLNGMAIENGKPRYVTALGVTDARGTWREKKATGGIVMDVNSNQIICTGLAMPHSPRVYQGDLWVLSSGTGELGIVNSLGFQPMIYLPGFLRGLAFCGPYAFIGLSKIREKRTFGGLPIEEKVENLRCSIEIVNLQTGLWEGRLEFHRSVEELYDVQIVPYRLPTIVGYDQPQDKQNLFDLPPSPKADKK